MGTLEDFVSVTITTVSQTPTQVGFGTPLVAGYHNAYPDRVRTYKKLTDASSDGLISTGVTAGIYAALAAIFSQNPRPKEVKVGRLSYPSIQSIVLTPSSHTMGEVYRFSFGPLGGTITDLVYTVPASTSMTQVCTALAALVTGLSLDVTVASSSTTVTLTAKNDGELFDVQNWTHNLSLQDATASETGAGVFNSITFALTSYAANTAFTINALDGTPHAITRTSGAVSIQAELDAIKILIDNLGLALTVTEDPASPSSTTLLIAATDADARFEIKSTTNVVLSSKLPVNTTLSGDLDAISLADNDFYGLALASNSKTEILAAAAWAETAKKLFCYNTSDTACGDSGSTTDVMYALKALSYFRTFGLYNGVKLLSYGGAAWLGEELPFAPGSSTFALKTLSGVPADSAVTPTQEGVILGKHGNTYTAVAGFNITNPGKSAAGEYVDITFGRDWLEARMKERVFGLLVSARKVPFTNTGVGLVVSGVKAQLQDGVTATFLAADPAPVVLAPLVKDISIANRANRILPDITFSATLAGAIQAVEISGVISV